ncbi:DUF4374 domain-containing protein [Pedobacter psychroterrae]|uniref:DUF4374 domain-containing protein n=1 Tax=Pedobacter psychroterrae TaxID=2530453 RepID=A0A4R0ND28_9SPHI|nr:DUF4374 domain-containing protein [Pedobacter psychroterrae]TCC98260.1 DUF4374 domain-containing protein [Pedobacter psychroterrae]
MKTLVTKTLLALAFAGVLSSCEKKADREVIPENPGNYIIAVTPTAIAGKADYLLTASSLESGAASIIGNGVEQDGTYRYYVTANNKLFSMLYGQGSPGAVTVYGVTDGKLNKLNDYTSATVHAFAPVGDDILTVRVPRRIAAAGTPTVYEWYRVSTATNAEVAKGTVDAIMPSGNGEIAHLSWIKQVGNKVFAPYFSIYNSFFTKFPDQAGIAVFSYPQMQYEKTIRDTRTSFIGRYFVDGLGLVENGDCYAFSSSVAADDDPATTAVDAKMTSTKPSAITRIKAGTTEFDMSYFFNFEEASNGYVITNWLNIGQNKFIANIEPKLTKGQYVTGKRLAIVDVVAKTVKAVTGFPEVKDISSVTTTNYSPKDGKTGYVGVNLASGATYVYKIDASTATATQGIKVEGGVITAIQHLQ